MADPAQLSRCSTTAGASGRLDAAPEVSWEFADLPVPLAVSVLESHPPQRLVISGGGRSTTAATGATTVTVEFEALDGDTRTLVTITGSSWQPTPEGAASAFGDREGWTGMLRPRPTTGPLPQTAPQRSPAGALGPRGWLADPVRIFFTGGSGKAGHHVAPYLAAQGHQVTNADLTPLGHPDVTDLRVDLTDAGQVYSAMAGTPTMADLDDPHLAGAPGSAYDAVVHFAAVPRILLVPDATTFTTNVLAQYHVLEAATRLGIRKVVFASSETTYGVCFGQGDRKPLYVPVDEDHPVVPEDSYAMSKVAGEVVARSFQARTGADVYGLRINNVIEPDEYAELFPPFLDDPSLRRRNLFAYIDTRDLGQMTLRALETDGLGFEVFNAANADTSVAATTQEVIDTFYGGVEVRREMGRDETFYSIDKARDLLGYAPQHSWRDVLDDPRGGA